MIEELVEKDYHKVKHLFKERDFINRFRSHLEIPFGNPSRVFVDNLDDPQTAVIIVFPLFSFEIRLFFGGRADNKAFNEEFRNMLYERPIVKFPNYRSDLFLQVSCELSSNDWEEGIKSVLKDPELYTRYYYEISELKLTNWRERIPVGYNIEPVDLTLLEKNFTGPWYENVVLGDLKQLWFPFEEGLKENRGFILVKEHTTNDGNGEAVSVCMTESLTGDNDIEIVIGTHEKYRRKGLASIVGAATAEYCLSKYKSVGWHCNASNIGSYKTAEKIGFERKREYKKARVTINHVDNWIVNGFLNSMSKFPDFSTNNSRLLSNRAHILARLHRKEESISIIQDVVQREPDNGNSFEIYGEILLLFHEYEEALEKFQISLDLEPYGWSETYIKMGECYRGLRNYDKAVEYVEKGRDLAAKRKEEEWITRANKLLSELKN